MPRKTRYFYVFGCSICQCFCRFANGGAKIFDAWILRGLMWFSRSFFRLKVEKQVWQDFRITPYTNYAYIHCLKNTKDRKILSLWDFSWIRYLPQRTETLTCLNGQRILKLMACGTGVAYAKLISFVPFRLFSQNSKLESAVYSEQKKFCLAHHFCEMQREKNQLQEGGFDIAPPSIRESSNGVAKHIQISHLPRDSSLKRSGPRSWWIPPQANNDM